MLFSQIPTVPTAQELMDSAYGKASLLEKPDRDPTWRTKKTERARLEYVGKSLTGTLQKLHDSFPNFDAIHPYHQELAAILTDLHAVRRSLGSVGWAAATIEGIAKQFLQRFARAREPQEVLSAKRVAYGRISSVLKEVDSALAVLASAREALRRLPAIDPADLTVVIAGYPNVGKSSLVILLTNARPEVAAYPFTTKHASVGHLNYDALRAPAGTKGAKDLPTAARDLIRLSPTRRVQFIDTPGLLDRPETERNDVERQASLALRHLADVILFLFDPTEQCGYLVPDQEALLRDLRRLFPSTPFVVAENKADIGGGRGLGIPLSAETGKGMDELFAALVAAAKSQELPAEVSEFFRADAGAGFT